MSRQHLSVGHISPAEFIKQSHFNKKKHKVFSLQEFEVFEDFQNKTNQFIKANHSVCVHCLTYIGDLVSHHVLVVVDSGKRNLLLLWAGRHHKQPLDQGIKQIS